MKKRNREGLYAYHFPCHVCMYISVSVNRWSFIKKEFKSYRPHGFILSVNSGKSYTTCATLLEKLIGQKIPICK
jgi:hypothetical protein